LTRAPGPLRLVDVTPQGVLAWIGRPDRSAERDLIERLLWRAPEAALDLRLLAEEMGSSFQEVTRTLFTLNRQHGLTVSTGSVPARPGQDFQNGLLGDLRDLTAAAGQAVLTTRDGLCLAEAGCHPHQASLVADRLGKAQAAPSAITLHFALEQVTLFADHAVDQTSLTWVSLARRLIHVCGALSFGSPSR
jgi:hypothetical protein